MMKTVNRKAGYLILIVGLVACSAKSVKNSEEKDTDSVSIEVPSFDTDSAYAYIERQVQFGFRVPNTPAHLATADYLSSELARHGAVVEVRQGTVTAYDGTELSIRNIIGSFSPEKKNRILLFAHWDSRPYADNDPDKSKHRQPIAGADDGASGGILLDMVGGAGAQFRRELFSKYYASGIVAQVWDTAKRLGYGNYFIEEDGGYVTDDHLYVNRYGIPSIDIIPCHRDTETGFPPYWHTVDDTMRNIDRSTLKAVGQTVLTVLYEE